MKTRTTCRVCDGGLEFILSLGELYVSNFPTPEEHDGLKAPLDLVLCDRCRLLQLRDTVPPEALYRNYWYQSGTNRSMRMALAEIANEAENLIHLGSGDTVLDIGCNDGTLLAAYKTRGIYKIGFDPARNLLANSIQVADRIVPDFFSSESFLAINEIAGRRPKIVSAIAMFYDLEDPNAFVADVKKVMDPEGVLVIQMSYLASMIRQNAFDNICHEHLEYYSLYAFEHLLNKHDLEVVDMQLNDVNGGSFRVYVRARFADRTEFGDLTYRRLAAQRLRNFREQEERMLLDRVDTYRDFASWVGRIKSDVIGFVEDEVEKGRRVYVYGASTKGNTLLQYFGFNRGTISAATERNPDKWGKLTVGTRIPIISEEEARADRPDYFLVLPWHFIEEFQERESEYLAAGGRFIVPLPHFSLI